MKTTITARHFQLEEELHDYMLSKLERLNRFSDNITSAELILGWEKQIRYAELKLGLSSSTIVVKEESEDLRKSFDLLMDKAERQLKKYKDKRRSNEKDVINSA